MVEAFVDTSSISAWKQSEVKHGSRLALNKLLQQRFRSTHVEVQHHRYVGATSSAKQAGQADNNWARGKRRGEAKARIEATTANFTTTSHEPPKVFDTPAAPGHFLSDTGGPQVLARRRAGASRSYDKPTDRCWRCKGSRAMDIILPCSDTEVIRPEGWSAVKRK